MTYLSMKSLMICLASASPCTLLNFWNPDHVWIYSARSRRLESSTWVKCRSLLKQNWEWVSESQQATNASSSS